MAEKNTNMDLNKPSNSDGPQLQFTLPIEEVQEKVSVGDKGTIMIPVEVTQVQDGFVSFMKRGKASSQTNFQSLSLDEEREDIGVAER